MIQIIPAIDLRGGKCVRLRQGDYGAETIFGDDPVATARRWVEAGAQRMHIVDLDGAKAGRPENGAKVREIVAALPIPCEFGGGVRDDETLDQVLEDFGVNWAVVGTAALKDPDWFRAAAKKHPQKLILGLDARNGRVATAGWLEVSEVTAGDLLDEFADLPLAGVIYTNIAADGMMQGIDDATLADLADLAGGPHPVIASGGVSSLGDILKLTALAKNHNKIVGAIVGRALYEGAIDLAEAIAVARDN